MTTEPPPSELFRELVERRDFYALRGALTELDAPSIADLLWELDAADRAVVFRLLPHALADDVFAYLDTEREKALIDGLTDEEVRRLLAGMKPDDRTGLLEELPGLATQRLLNLLSTSDLAEARTLLGYPEDSVGRLMTPDYVAVRPQWSIAEALTHIRARGRDSETINVVYVVDNRWRLLDALDLSQFILASPSARVEDIMDGSYVALQATADREEAVELMRRHDLLVLPITDTRGVLIGIVTIDDVLDVAQEETTEDFHRIGGVAPLEMSYTLSPILSLYQKRIGWLSILVVVNIASSGVIEAYEEVLATTIALAFFIPLLIDSGGNAGSQAATIMVRAIATGDVQLRQWFRVVFRELRIGLGLGISMGVLAAALGLWRGGAEVGLVVGMAMVSIVLVANLVGTVMPFVLTRLRLDPAAASAPLITTIADVTGLMLYFTIAALILGTGT
jgi:magnesium transporter